MSFFFSSRRRHTRWTGDWSSDVCSSDLSPPASSDCDIDVPVALDDVEFLQLDALVGDMNAVGEMKLVAVPRTDDVHVVAVEGLAVVDAVLVDELLHLRHHQALAGGTALVRAVIAIGVVLSAVTDDADLDLVGAHDPHPAFRHVAVLADQNLGHRPPPISHFPM